MRKNVLGIIMLLVASTIVAQTTSYEVKSGTVVSTWKDQLVVKMSNGETKEYTIPAGFQFTVDGKSVGLADLQPGQELTAVIKTTKKPVTVRTVSVRNGEVIKVMGNNLWVKEDGQVKNIKVPDGYKFKENGREIGVADLRPGHNLTAEIVSVSEKIETSRDVGIAGYTPAPPPTQMAEAAPAPAEAAPVKLPKTGSKLPLFAVFGALFMITGLALHRV